MASSIGGPGESRFAQDWSVRLTTEQIQGLSKEDQEGLLKLANDYIKLGTLTESQRNTLNEIVGRAQPAKHSRIALLLSWLFGITLGKDVSHIQKALEQANAARASLTGPFAREISQNPKTARLADFHARRPEFLKAVLDSSDPATMLNDSQSRRVGLGQRLEAKRGELEAKKEALATQSEEERTAAIQEKQAALAKVNEELDALAPELTRVPPQDQQSQIVLKNHMNRLTSMYAELQHQLEALQRSPSSIDESLLEPLQKELAAIQAELNAVNEEVEVLELVLKDDAIAPKMLPVITFLVTGEIKSSLPSTTPIAQEADDTPLPSDYRSASMQRIEELKDQLSDTQLGLNPVYERLDELYDSDPEKMTQNLINARQQLSEQQTRQRQLQDLALELENHDGRNIYFVNGKILTSAQESALRDAGWKKAEREGALPFDLDADPPPGYLPTTEALNPARAEKQLARLRDQLQQLESERGRIIELSGNEDGVQGLDDQMSRINRGIAYLTQALQLAQEAQGISFESFLEEITDAEAQTSSALEAISGLLTGGEPFGPVQAKPGVIEKLQEIYLRQHEH